MKNERRWMQILYGGRGIRCTWGFYIDEQIYIYIYIRHCFEKHIKAIMWKDLEYIYARLDVLGLAKFSRYLNRNNSRDHSLSQTKKKKRNKLHIPSFRFVVFVGSHVINISGYYSQRRCKDRNMLFKQHSKWLVWYIYFTYV